MMAVVPDPVDFFVSYPCADRPWAEWIAWELDEAGYRTRARSRASRLAPRRARPKGRYASYGFFGDALAARAP